MVQSGVQRLGKLALGPRLGLLLGLLVLALLVLVQWLDPAPIQRLRLQVFDAFQVAAPLETEADSGVVVVDIDEDAIATLGQWPWPRTDIATLTRRLGDAGASAVVFDIVFSENDRTSPAMIAERYADPALRAALQRLPGHDALLAESFAAAPVVTGYFLDRQAMGRAVEPKASFTIHGSVPAAHVAHYAGALLPLPALEAAATGSGFVTIEGDGDGIVRRVPLVALHRGTLVPSLTLEAVRVATGGDAPNLLTSDGSGQTTTRDAAAVAVRIAGREIPVNDAGEMWVHFPAPGRQVTLPAGPVVTGAMTDAALAAAVAGRIVFVGGRAQGLQDLVSTPLTENTAGVNVHAAAAAQIMAGQFLERPDWAGGLEMLAVLLLGALLALLLPRLGALWGALVALAGVAGVAAASWLAFMNLHLLLDPTWPVLAIVAVYAVQTVTAYYREERQRSYIRSAFDRYLSPELVRQIAADPGKLELGGEERDMTVLMADIRGFSRISEHLGPRQVIDFLIAFLTPMSEILLARRATLDKYIGDAVLAFWNAPLDDPDQHANAARAALAMLAATEELNRTMPAREGVTWPGEVKIGIGLNSGLCCVGNMGSTQRLSYTLIGDTVNMASRLEGLTKQYGVGILTGSALAAALPQFALLELDRVQVVGRDAPETVFALLGDEVMAASPAFVRLAAQHAAFLGHYRAQEWQAAEAALAAGEDYAALQVAALREIMLARVTKLQADAPGEGWDGVFRASEK